MEKQSNKVFVGGLSWTTDDAKLRSYFENFGTVLEAFCSYDKYTGANGWSGAPAGPCRKHTTSRVHAPSAPRPRRARKATGALHALRMGHFAWVDQ